MTVILMLYRYSKDICLKMMLLFWSSNLHIYPELGGESLEAGSKLGRGLYVEKLENIRL